MGRRNWFLMAVAENMGMKNDAEKLFKLTHAHFFEVKGLHYLITRGFNVYLGFVVGCELLSVHSRL